MNFTREPIIETVISPKDGSKLLIRNSTESNREEYLVESVEVVSFGDAVFFRSTEWPRSFLVPVSDYEVVEEKEARMVLKNVPIERSIKIAGTKDVSRPQQKEEEKVVSEEGQDRNLDKRRDRRRPRPKQNSDNRPVEKKPDQQIVKEVPVVQSSERPQEEKKEGEEAKVSPSIIRKLFPPPLTLINEKFKRPENKEAVKEVVKEEKPKEEEKIEPPVKLDGEEKKEEPFSEDPGR